MSPRAGSRRVPAPRLAGCRRVLSALLLFRRRRRQGGVCFESGPERADSTGKMATAGSAERPGRPASAVAGRSRSGSGPGARCGSGSGSSPPEDEVTKCAACVEAQPGGSSPCGHPACPLCLARRHPGNKERVRRRSDPESSSSSRAGRRDCDSQRGRCVYCTNYSSHTATSAPSLVVCSTNETREKHRNIQSPGQRPGQLCPKFSLNRRRPGELISVCQVKLSLIEFTLQNKSGGEPRLAGL